MRDVVTVVAASPAIHRLPRHRWHRSATILSWFSQLNHSFG